MPLQAVTEIAHNINNVRYHQLKLLLAGRFGIGIKNYPQNLIINLLKRLPAEINTTDELVLKQIISACSIGETSFLRHREQFDILKSLLPTLPCYAQSRKMKIWSAGCASGEEVYSLAATLKKPLAGRLKVVGSDLNEDLLQRAKTGHYRFWSLRNVTAKDTEGWLSIGEDRVEIAEDLKKYVSFTPINLAVDNYPQGFDLIFCRNVLIYLCADTIQSVYQQLASSILPGGILMIGPTDPMPSSSEWQPELSDGVLFYRRTNSVCPKISPNSASLVDETDRQTTITANEYLQLVRGFASQQNFADAISLLQEGQQEYPFEAEISVLLAMVADEAGDIGLALQTARRAVFLVPDAPFPEYLLALYLDKQQESSLARQRANQVRKKLSAISDLSQPLSYGEGITGNQLRRMIDARFN